MTRDEENARNEEDETGKMGRSCQETHPNERWEWFGCSVPLFTRWGLGYLYVKSESVEIRSRYSERGKVGESEQKLNEDSICQLQTAQGRMRKESCIVRGCDKDENKERKGEEQEERTRD